MQPESRTGGVHRDRSREAAIVGAYQSGKSLRDVGVEFGVSGERVRQILALAGVATRGRGQRRFDRAEAARLYASGLSLLEIAVRLGVTQTPVHRALCGMGVEMRPRGRQAANHQLPVDPSTGHPVSAYPHQRRDVGRPVAR